ncbi:C40 family peptidase [Hymenobacter cellulosilyticus]|uniref:NlpC/P60 family protein n=1 Tax=Hymenobacter cellulosilyticus TaxID=2932248 RepID=A0A8T9Q1G6_9BACT|nr:C40 family peptidase [Hymenobacter cellulosilyticus]UOQ70742.1 NlpC/P60 family protein [Hymenobacter cellulosilyticus]
MRYVWLAFLTLAAAILAFFGWQRVHTSPGRTLAVVGPSVPARAVSDTMPAVAPVAGELPGADRLIDFAMQQLGSPYTYAGTTPTGGFDCSGFLMYVYNHVGIAVPHSTALLIDAGRAVPREQARRGDMVIFTGTAKTSTTPGHAGIIISDPGEPLRFIHSSSARRESGVKISQVEGTDYERRFMGIRRVLDGAVPASKPDKAGASPVAPVATLKPKTPQVATKLVVAPPKVHRQPLRRSKAKTVVKSAASTPSKLKVKAKSGAARKPAPKAPVKKTSTKKPVAPKKN